MKTIFKVAVVLAFVLSFAQAEAARHAERRGGHLPLSCLLGVGL